MQRLQRVLPGWQIVVRLVLCVGLVFCFTAQKAEKRPYLVSSVIPEAKQSYYSAKLDSLLKEWPPKGVPEKIVNRPIWMRGIRNPDKDNYIGIIKSFVLQASFEKVAEQIEDFDKYTSIFADLKKISVVSRDENKVVTEWERKSPLFFIPNFKYQQAYIIDQSKKDRRVYRYQLIVSNAVNYTDGLIVIEPWGDDKKSTRLVAYDFFDANWGLLKTLSPQTAWVKSLEGSFLGDMAFKARAEHPDWDIDQIEDFAKAMLDQFPVEPIQYAELDLK